MMRRSGARPAVKRSKFCLRDVAPCGIRPHRGDAILKVRRRLPDRGGRHQRMAGGAVLAAPGRRTAVRAGRGLRRRAGFRAGEDVAEKVRNPVAGGWGLRLGLTDTAGWNTTARPRLASRRLDCSSLVQSDPCRARPSQLNPVSEGPATVSNSLTEGILLSRPAQRKGRRNDHHTSAFVRGCKPAINVQSKHFPHFQHSSLPRPPISHENP